MVDVVVRHFSASDRFDCTEQSPQLMIRVMFFVCSQLTKDFFRRPRFCKFCLAYGRTSTRSGHLTVSYMYLSNFISAFLH